jgi:hypothetical protein
LYSSAPLTADQVTTLGAAGVPSSVEASVVTADATLSSPVSVSTAVMT